MSTIQIELQKATEEWFQLGDISWFTIGKSVYTSLPSLSVNPKKLAIQGTRITTLCADDFPPGVEMLYFYDNKKLETIISFPDTVTSITISSCPCITLPASLPPNLETLFIDGTNACSFEHLILPESLKAVRFDYNKQLSQLPKRLPLKLVQFGCINTCVQLRDIPIVPASLVKLSYLRYPVPYKYLPDFVFRELENEYSLRIVRWKQFVYSLPTLIQDCPVLSRMRSIQRCKAVKGDLMAVTWHTNRVLDWCDPKAFDYED